jgi:hypothetical protein
VFIHEADGHGMIADLGAASAHPEHQMRPGMHGRELRHPDMLKQSQHRELALLVDQGVIGQDREIEQQLRPPGWT